MAATEIVWDHEGTATAISGVCSLPAGPETAWSAPLLLATAAGSSLLETFLALAHEASITLLGYVAQQTPIVDELSDSVVEIAITACISVPSEQDARGARLVWEAATRTAPVLRALACAINCESHVVVLSEIAGEPA